MIVIKFKEEKEVDGNILNTFTVVWEGEQVLTVGLPKEKYKTERDCLDYMLSLEKEIEEVNKVEKQ